MKAKWIFLIFLGLVGNVLVVPTALALPETTMDKIDAALTQQVAHFHNVGIVIGIVENGKTTFKKYGKENLFSSNIPNENSVFEIGSVTKVFTAIALGSLVQEGRVALNDPVSKYVPELSGFPAGNITLKELATHTSGLARMPDAQHFNPADPLNPYKDYTASALIEYLKSLNQVTPTPVYDLNNYSNTGFGLLGYVVSRASQLSYEEVIKQRILIPLGMQDTSITLSPDQQSRFLQGYTNLIEPTPAWDFDVYAGAGALHSTVSDLLKFVQANLVSPTTPITRLLNLSQTPEASGPKGSIGLGWQINDAEQRIWHTGGTYGFSSLVSFNKSKNLGLVVLTNTASPVKCVEDLVFGKECRLPAEHDISQADLEKFIGNYQLRVDLVLTVTRNENFLIAQATGQPKFRLRALDDHQFDLADGLATVTFIKDQNGQVNALTLLQNGQVHEAKRVTGEK